MKHILLIITALFVTVGNADVVMGIVPQQSPLKLLKMWEPIAEYLSEKTSEKVIFKTEKSISKFEEVLYKGGYDFAYMNPFHFIVANKVQGYEARVRATKNLRGILVQKKASQKNKSIDNNSRFLFPAPNAFAATLLIKYDLVQKYNVNLSVLNKALYVNSHDSVYKGISRGIGDFGGGIERTFNNLNDMKTKNALLVVHRTKAYPSHPFAFNPTMPQKLQKQLSDALLTMPNSYLKPLNIKALKAVNNDEYNSVRELAIKLKIMPK
jgi:phosphonate transport system substrate-binding protein